MQRSLEEDGEMVLQIFMVSSSHTGRGAGRNAKLLNMWTAKAGTIAW